VPALGVLGGRIPHLIETLPEDQGTPGVNPNHLAGILTLYLPLALGLMAGLIGLHAYGLTDAVALGSKPAVAFWFALGLVVCLDRVPGLEARLSERGESAREGTGMAPWSTHRLDVSCPPC